MQKTGERERLIETFGEVAQAMGCSVSYVQKLWSKYGFSLKHRLKNRGRIRMTFTELERFKKRIKQGN